MSAAGRSKLVIINTANRPWTVIDSQTLMALEGVTHTAEYYYSPMGRPFEAAGHDTDKKLLSVLSEQDLIEKLTAAQADIFYLRVSPHTRSEYLISSVMQAFPSIPLVVEFYDMCLLFDVKALSYIYADDEEQIKAAQQAVKQAFHKASAVVVKMGGADFAAWSSSAQAPIMSYFPALGVEALTHGSKPKNSRRLLYAGSLSAREITGGLGSVDGANLIRYFDAIEHEDGLQLDIVNAVHGDESEDTTPKFAAFLARYKGALSLAYHRSMPLDHLIKWSTKFDIGICCAHYQNDKVMDVTRFGVPNRMMTYLAAGLPVVIDDRFAYAARLISQFGAGAVVEAGNMEAFTAALKTLDLDKAAQGVAALKVWMQKENAVALSKLTKVMV